MSIYTEYPEDGHRESVSKLIVERQATEDDLEENSVLNEVGESIWIFSAEIMFCPYCGSELKSPIEISKESITGAERYGKYSLFDQEKWEGCGESSHRK